MKILWIKRYFKSGQVEFALYNLAGALLCSLLIDIIFLFSNSNKYSPIEFFFLTTLLLMIPTWLMFPTLIGRLFIEYKYRNDGDYAKNDNTFGKIQIANVIIVILMITIISATNNKRGYYEDGYEKYDHVIDNLP